MSSGKKLYKTNDILNLQGLVSVSSFSCKKVYIRMQDAVPLGREYLCGSSKNCLFFAKMQAKLTSPWHHSQSLPTASCGLVFSDIVSENHLCQKHLCQVCRIQDVTSNLANCNRSHVETIRLRNFFTFFLLKEHLYMFISAMTLILAVWPQVVPLSAASTSALEHRWRSAFRVHWGELAPGSWGCAAAPGRVGPPVTLESPEAYLDPHRCRPASATGQFATQCAPAGGRTHAL